MKYLKQYEELDLKNIFSRKKKVTTYEPKDSVEPKDSETDQNPKEKKLTLEDILDSIDSPAIESINQKNKESYEIILKDSFIKPLLKGTILDDIYKNSSLTLTFGESYGREEIKWYFSIYTTEDIRKKIDLHNYPTGDKFYFHNSGGDGVTLNGYLYYNSGNQIIDFVENFIENMKEKIDEISDYIKNLLEKQEGQLLHQKSWDSKVKELQERKDDISDYLIELEDMSSSHSIDVEHGSIKFKYSIKGVSVIPIQDTQYASSSQSQQVFWRPGDRSRVYFSANKAQFNYTSELGEIFKIISSAEKKIISEQKDVKVRIEFQNDYVMLDVHIPYQEYQHEPRGGHPPD